MTRRPPQNPEELLAAYADDGLDADEQRAVENHLAGDPGAGRELDRMRELIAQVRRSAPQPAAPPNWDAMAARINRRCAQPQDRERARTKLGAWSRLRRWFTLPRYVLAAAAVAAIVLWVVARGPELESAATRPVATGDRESAPAGGYTPAAPEGPGDDSLAGDGVDGMGLVDDGALDDGEGFIEYATGFDLEMFAEPDYAGWLDELSDDDLDALDEYLHDVQAG